MNLDGFKTVEKVWGTEVWLVNNERYCTKLLHIKPGYQCSLHMHPIKKETFIVLDGGVNLEILPAVGTTDNKTNSNYLVSGESYTLDPGTYHRFSSYTGEEAVILEISSTHSDDDVVRLENSKAL